MQNLDPKSLFSIFEQGDEEIYAKHQITDAMKNPFVLMGSVLSGISNYELMDVMYTRNYPERYGEVRGVIKYKYFARIYKYLTLIDSSKFETIYKIGDSFDSKQVELALAYLLYYYEDLEEYEKCAVIKRYMDLLREVSVRKVGYLI